METDKVRLYEVKNSRREATCRLGEDLLDVHAVCANAYDENGELYYVYYSGPGYTPEDWQRWVETEVDIENPIAVRRPGERYAEDGTAYTVDSSLSLSWNETFLAPPDVIRRAIAEMKREEAAPRHSPRL